VKEPNAADASKAADTDDTADADDTTDADDTDDTVDAANVTDATDVTDATTATDATDATDFTDTIDATDAAIGATDVTDATDAATDVIEATDVTDAADATDTDATDAAIDADDATDATGEDDENLEAEQDDTAREEAEGGKADGITEDVEYTEKETNEGGEGETEAEGTEVLGEVDEVREQQGEGTAAEGRGRPVAQVKTVYEEEGEEEETDRKEEVEEGGDKEDVGKPVAKAEVKGDEGDAEKEDGSTDVDVRNDEPTEADAEELEPELEPKQSRVTSTADGSAAFTGTTAVTSRRREEAKEVCASWNGAGAAMVRKAYWITVQGSLTANELRRADACRLGKRDKNDKTCTLRATPGEFRRVGAPSLARLDNGTMLAFWQAAEDTEGEDFQHLRMSASRSGDGKAWQHAVAPPLPPPEGARGSNPRWTPVPHVAEDGRLFLFFTESTADRSCRLLTHPKRTWAPGGAIRVAVASSDLTRWEDPRTILPLEENGPGSAAPKVLSGRLIVAAGGEWILPFCRDASPLTRAKWPTEERAAACGARSPPLDQATSGCGVLVSMDTGATWQARAVPALSAAKSAAAGAGGPNGGPISTQLGDASVVEVGTGGLLLLLKSRTGGHVYQSLSSSLGTRWTSPRPIGALPNPDAKVHSFRLQPAGPLAVVYNDHSKLAMAVRAEGDNGGGEGEEPGSGGGGGATDGTLTIPVGCVTQLTLGLSGDNGKTWRQSLVLRGGTAAGMRMSQPWILQSGCKLLVAYVKDYAPGAKQLENDRELGIRIVHVAM
jgi:hypothetical protein